MPKERVAQVDPVVSASPVDHVRAATRVALAWVDRAGPSNQLLQLARGQTRPQARIRIRCQIPLARPAGRLMLMERVVRTDPFVSANQVGHPKAALAWFDQAALSNQVDRLHQMRLAPLLDRFC